MLNIPQNIDKVFFKYIFVSGKWSRGLMTEGNASPLEATQISRKLDLQCEFYGGLKMPPAILLADRRMMPPLQIREQRTVITLYSLPPNSPPFQELYWKRELPRKSIEKIRQVHTSSPKQFGISPPNFRVFWEGNWIVLGKRVSLYHQPQILITVLTNHCTDQNLSFPCISLAHYAYCCIRQH